MADYPQPGVPPLFINSFSRWTMWSEMALGANLTGASLTWVANQALYIPFALPWPYPVRRVFWANGSSITTTNRDFGIYTADGAQIYHTGSTSASGVNAIQYVTLTEFLLSPGRYYMAIATDNAVAARGGAGVGSVNLARGAMAGLVEEATAFPLPATMTPVTFALAVFPVCGFTSTSSGF